jgi:hypothetical protein
MSSLPMEDLVESLAGLWPTEAPGNLLTTMRQTAGNAIISFQTSNVACRSKTVGVMLVESTGQMQAAVSGWTTWMYNIATLPQISQAEALTKVTKLTSIIGHQLGANDLDQGQTGRYYACHCEKQLAANYYFDDLTGEPAKIVISKEPCRDCWDFFARLELILNLRVDILVNDHISLQGRNNALFRQWLQISGGTVWDV